MKRAPIVTTLLLATVLLTAAAAVAGNRPIVRVTEGPPVPDQYVVVFSDQVRTLGNGHAVNAAEALARAFNASYEHTWDHAIKGALFRMNEHKAQAMARHPLVDYVAEDGTAHVFYDQPNPPSWGLDRIDQRNLPLDSNYHYDCTGLGVTAYVIDTGIRTTHVDFGGRASWGADFVDGTFQDCYGHGTHVAGTLGGTSYGVAKDVDLVAVRVLDCYGWGTWADVISGVDWVTANAVHPAVANMSLGGGYYQPVNDAVTNSVASGVFYAIAAGNSYGADACNYSPASTPTAYTVGATESNDNRAGYSNVGTCLDIFAPGTAITSAWHTSDTATNTIQGTSMATPHVAGGAAMILEGNPGWTPAQVSTELTNTATAGVVGNPGTGSPNLLLYTGELCADTGPCVADYYLGDYGLTTLQPLWAKSNRCVTPYSAPDHWSYTQTSTCNYDTGSANSGYMTTHSWGLYGFNCVRIKFRHYWQTESYPYSYDRHWAELSLDGGSTYPTQIQFDDSLTPSSGGLWVQEDSGPIPIGPAVTTRVRFSFDTVDSLYNYYLGCYVDNVELWVGW